MMSEKLTVREKWLMREALQWGIDLGDSCKNLDESLADYVSDHGHTVEQLIAYEAPKEDGDE
jgi:hypothetical protein